MRTKPQSSQRKMSWAGMVNTLALIILFSCSQKALAQQHNLTRTLPTTVNSEVDIGDFAFTAGGGSLWISVTVPSIGYSVAKQYLLPIQHHQSGNVWQTALPASSTGPYAGNDFALDIKVNLGTASLRLRTTASNGGYVGTAYIVIKQEGANDTFTPSTTISAVSAPTTFFGSTALTQVGGNVGIGTTNPFSPAGFERVAHLRHSSSASYVVDAGGVYRAEFGVSSNGGWVSTADNIPLRFVTANSEKMRIDSSGNVGIGTTTPSAKLHLFVDSNSGLRFLLEGGGPEIQYKRTNAVTLPDGLFRHTIGPDGNFYLQRNTAAAGDFGTATNPFIITKSDNAIFGGNVGIGTVNPSYKLDVAGVISSSTGGFRFPDGTVQLTAASGGGGGTISGVTAGTGLTGGGTSGAVTLTNNDKGSDQFIFKNVANVAGTTQFSATSNNDAVRFAGTGGTTVSFDTGTKKITVDSSGITSSQWTTSDSNINYASGNVGIGTTTPGAKLEVVGNVNVTGTGNITAAGTIEGGNVKAKYQDVAEWVESSQELSTGTLVVLDHTRSNQVIASSQAYDTRVAGVISAQPGIELGEPGDNKVLVATTGRVKVKVDASRGPIQIGDLLATSDIAGVAMKSEAVSIGGVQIHRPGTIIGKALEPLAKGSGEILVLLSLQ